MTSWRSGTARGIEAAARDTNVLLWAVSEPEQLSPDIERLVADPNLAVLASAASAWELATKYRLGKLPSAALLATSFEQVIQSHGFDPLAITVGHGRLAGSFPARHKDPFDRMLAAQAIVEGAVLVSPDAQLDQFGVQRLW